MLQRHSSCLQKQRSADLDITPVNLLQEANASFGRCKFQQTPIAARKGCRVDKRYKDRSELYGM